MILRNTRAIGDQNDWKSGLFLGHLDLNSSNLKVVILICCLYLFVTIA
jgi:hypothetical protein